MEGEEVSLITLTSSPFAMAAKIALAEAGVAYVAHEETNFPVKSELLLKSSPILKQIPVLIHKGAPICESLVVLAYIEEALGGKFLLPEGDLLARANARFWATFCNTKFWESSLGMLRKHGEEAVNAKHACLDLYRTLDAELGKRGAKPFFFGEKISMPDVVLAPLVSWIPSLEALGEFKFPGADECPHMSAWLDAIAVYPSVKASIADPQMILPAVLGLRKMILGMKK